MLYTIRENKVKDSSLIKAFGTNGGTMDIEFLDGSIYRYFFTPKKLERGLKETKSPGRYFVKKILGVYPFKRLA